MWRSWDSLWLLLILLQTKLWISNQKLNRWCLKIPKINVWSRLLRSLIRLLQHHGWWLNKNVRARMVRYFSWNVMLLRTNWKYSGWPVIIFGSRLTLRTNLWTSVFNAMKSMKEGNKKWVQQLNTYAAILRSTLGIEVTNLYIHARLSWLGKV